MPLVKIPQAHIPVRVNLVIQETAKYAMMWTNVLPTLTDVTSTLCVTTVTDRTTVHATLDFQEMGKHVLISMSVPAVSTAATSLLHVQTL